MLTIREAMVDAGTIDESVLAKLSDRLWVMGSLSEIQEKVTPELFDLHICVNMIGSWQNDGWWLLISEQAELVPLIPRVLERLELHEIKAAFEQLTALFPPFTVFSNADKTYCDIVSFLQNARFKVADERLNAVSAEDRKALVDAVHRAVEELEALTHPVWGCRGKDGGWSHAIQWIKQSS